MRPIALTMTSDELQNCYNFVLKEVRDAGEYFLQSKNEVIAVENKSAHELVTKYDKNIEALLISKIKAKYPSHKFIGEEASGLANTRISLTNDPTWIIDPVDGTTNFSRKIPMSGISVGLTINKEQTLGVVNIPYLNEFYSALKGRGAFLNEETIRCSNITDPKEAVLCYEIGAASSSTHHHKLIMSRLNVLTNEVLTVRCFGCPILSQCYVASGKLDVYQCDGLHPWDAAAGILIVKEAGGTVMESSGEAFDLMRPNFLASATRELGERVAAINRSASGN